MLTRARDPLKSQIVSISKQTALQLLPADKNDVHFNSNPASVMHYQLKKRLGSSGGGGEGQ